MVTLNNNYYNYYDISNARASATHQVQDIQE